MAGNRGTQEPGIEQPAISRRSVAAAAVGVLLVGVVIGAIAVWQAGKSTPEASSPAQRTARIDDTLAGTPTLGEALPAPSTTTADGRTPLPASVEPSADVEMNGAAHGRAADETGSDSVARDTDSLEDVVSQASPAVVSVETTTARGTGFFVTPNTVVTNAHVVDGHTYVTVKLAAGSTINARVTTTTDEYDLALIRVDAAPAAQIVLPMRTAQAARVGQEVVAIGSALGVLQNTVTRGIISAFRRAGPVLLVQTDAAINRGNSGGPLIDRQGRVIGVTTLKMSGGGAESIGFAVAIDHVLPLIQQGPPAPLAGGAPVMAAPPGLAPSTRSATDETREHGTQQFEAHMQTLAQRAAEIDVYWEQFRTACAPRLRGQQGDREWFGIWEDRPALGSEIAACASRLAELVQAGRSFRTAMAAADEFARRAEVYPGVRRDIRRRYRVDWAGWER
jgi:S1-C subfamily serine protease